MHKERICEEAEAHVKDWWNWYFLGVEISKIILFNL